MKAFEGLRVLELGRFIAVPLCGQMLAEAGADVIKVEDLDGDQSRHNGPIVPFEGRQFLNKNRGKRSISAQLGDPDVLAAIQRLAANSDVVLANFRPGLAQQLGLDYAAVRATNPTVIYAENTAYGPAGPMRDMPGMDIVLQAFTGLAHMSAEGPEQLTNPIIDQAAAMLMAWGVSTALYHRERTGRGQRLDVSLLHAAMFLETNQLIHVDVVDGWREEFVAYLKHAFADGHTWKDVLEHRAELQPHRVMRAYYGFFPTADGMVAVACNARTLRPRMLEVLGVEDRWTTEDGWQPSDAAVHEEQIRQQVIDRFRSETTSHWVRAFRAKGLPIGPARHSDELFADPQVRANGFLVDLEHELLGAHTLVAPPVHFDETPCEARPAPPLGKHSREVLVEAGLDDAAIGELVARGVVRDITIDGARQRKETASP
jgi:formyl-CoA transferase